MRIFSVFILRRKDAPGTQVVSADVIERAGDVLTSLIEIFTRRYRLHTGRYFTGVGAAMVWGMAWRKSIVRRLACRNESCFYCTLYVR